MVEGEILTKGIILAVYPQGEYGKRVSLLSDRFGKITVFARGAAKQSSRSIGALRPLVNASFTLMDGKNAKMLMGVNVIDSFEEIPLDPEVCFYGTYVLEFADYLAEEGMPEEEAKKMLNLMYLTLKALREHAMPKELIRRIFELRMLVHEGVYTEKPMHEDILTEKLWQYVLTSPLSALYRKEAWKPVLQGDLLKSECFDPFSESVGHLVKMQTDHRFRSEQLL